MIFAEGNRIHEVSELLGHSNPSTTADIYARALRDRQKKAVYGLADALLRNRIGAK